MPRWRALPADENDLLIAVKVGWESSIGVSGFHYPNGNELLDRPGSEDPTHGLDTQRIPDRGVATSGYAAARTIGLAQGGELTEAHQAEIVRRHLGDLCRIARECGVPRERLFIQIGGFKDEELLYDSAVNAQPCPGWSFYRHGRRPPDDAGVRRALARSDAPS